MLQCVWREAANPMTQTTDSLTLALTGALPFILILAAILTLVVSLGLLWLYRRAVLRSMQARAKAEEMSKSAMFALPESSSQPVRKRPNFTALDSSSPPLPESAAKALYTHVRKAPLRTATVYAIAGSSYALIMAAAFLVATQSEFHPIRLLALFWIYAWPIVLAVTFVGVTTRPTRLSLALLYFFFFALLGVFALAKSSTL